MITVEMRNKVIQRRVVLIGNMIRLASTIERGTTWSNPNPMQVAKREGWTIKSASKERALIDQVELAQEAFGYRLDPKTTLGRAYATAKAAEIARKAQRKSKVAV